MRQFLAPIERTAVLCGMEYLPPFIVYGTHGLTEDDIERHAEDYRRVVIGLRDRTLDLVAAAAHPRLNVRLDEVLGA